MEHSRGHAATPDRDSGLLQDSSPEEVATRLTRAPATTVYPLRHAVLRTGRAWSEVPYQSDDDPLSAHFAVLTGNSTLLAVGSVLPEIAEWYEGELRAWRVRGMAARSDLRGSGYGGQVLEALLSHVESEGGGMVWLSARVRAVPFYERHGFMPRGELKHVHGLGPHQIMWRNVP